MKEGQWLVLHNCVGGETFIQVFRIRNPNEGIHAGNLEFYKGTFGTEEEAQECADRLNREEEGG